MKTYCEGSGSAPVEIRRYPAPDPKHRLGKCGTCDRILKPTPGGLLRKHSVPGKNTMSSDRTLETLWAGAIAETEVGRHFAIGLPVYIRRGATPAGWEELVNPNDFVPKHWSDADYGRTYQIQSVGGDGTFEVMGWFWNPEDLVAA